MNALPQLANAEFTPPPQTSAPLLAQIERSVRARFEHLREVESGGWDAIKFELAICGQDIFHFFKWYAWTYDPRNVTETPPLPAWLPFDLYPRQEEMVKWFYEMLQRRQDGCLKKSRDIGFTWVAAGFAWHKWRWHTGFKTTFGSRKAEYVDRIGDPDSIFEKMRLLYRGLPKWMWPAGFEPRTHDTYMLLINPSDGNTVRGEAGDDMGRGGRSSLYFLDEAARIEHADSVDAATSANVDVRLWGSSINPKNENNLFQRKYRTFPPERVFVFHYKDDPRKTQDWAAKKRADVGEEVWASEYEIDDTYSVPDITIPAAWVEAAKQIRGLLTAKGIEIVPDVSGIVGGDVGGGKANSVAIARFGPVVTMPQAWTDPDTTDTALKMLDYAAAITIERKDGFTCKVRALRFDSIGIGQGVSATMKRNPRPGMMVIGVNVGDNATDAVWPDGAEANEKFRNLKAEGWFTARERFKRTHEMALWLQGRTREQGAHEHPVKDLIILPGDSEGPLATRLANELSYPKWRRTEGGLIIIESKESLARRQLSSPDVAEALILTFTGYSKAEKWANFARVVV